MSSPVTLIWWKIYLLQSTDIFLKQWQKKQTKMAYLHSKLLFAFFGHVTSLHRDAATSADLWKHHFWCVDTWGFIIRFTATLSFQDTKVKILLIVCLLGFSFRHRSSWTQFFLAVTCCNFLKRTTNNTLYHATINRKINNGHHDGLTNSIHYKLIVQIIVKKIKIEKGMKYETGQQWRKILIICTRVLSIMMHGFC